MSTSGPTWRGSLTLVRLHLIILKVPEQSGTTGKVRTIGVSNFSIPNLEILLASAKIVPANNQVELHPYLPQHDLKAYCEARGILLSAYSPFGKLLQVVHITTLAANQRLLGTLSSRSPSFHIRLRYFSGS